MTQRKEQTESALKRTVAMVIERDLSDPRIRGLVSVTRVDLSPDRRNLSVFVSVIPEEYEKRTLHGLRAATGHIQTRVAKKVQSRSIPVISFHLDTSLKRQAEVEKAIREGMAREHEQGQE